MGGWQCARRSQFVGSEYEWPQVRVVQFVGAKTFIFGFSLGGACGSVCQRANICWHAMITKDLSSMAKPMRRMVLALSMSLMPC